MSIDLTPTIRPAGSCRHRPISNGWSQNFRIGVGYGMAFAHCGYCKSLVEIDDEWRAKFTARGRAAPAPQAALGAPPAEVG